MDSHDDKRKREFELPIIAKMVCLPSHDKVLDENSD
jgi:hypothetical protein